MVYAVDTTGKEKWSFAKHDNVFSGAAIFENRMYIGCTGGKLYAFDIEGDGVADTPWPQFQRDHKNTGLYSRQ